LESKLGVGKWMKGIFALKLLLKYERQNCMMYKYFIDIFIQYLNIMIASKFELLTVFLCTWPGILTYTIKNIRKKSLLQYNGNCTFKIYIESEVLDDKVRMEKKK